MICCVGILVSFMIVIKLCWMKNQLNSINVMFLTFFLLNFVLASLQTFSLFNLGFTGFVEHPSEGDPFLWDCKVFMISWANYTVISLFLHFGMLFCRFIYTRYADGLLLMGKSLLHGLVCLMTVTFCIQHILFPIVKNVFHEENYPLNIIQGQICMKKNITQFQSVEQNKAFINRPKLMMIAFCSLMMMAALFMEFSAKKKANGYRIPKTRVNLMTMKQQCHYLVLLCLCVISGQITNIVIQVYYQKLGIDSVFNIWWVQHLLEMLLFHVVLNIWHFHNASTHLEQFNGLVAKQFPGQQKPRSFKIIPRRDEPNVQKTNLHKTGLAWRQLSGQPISRTRKNSTVPNSVYLTTKVIHVKEKDLKKSGHTEKLFSDV